MNLDSVCCSDEVWVIVVDVLDININGYIAKDSTGELCSHIEKMALGCLIVEFFYKEDFTCGAKSNRYNFFKVCKAFINLRVSNEELLSSEYKYINNAFLTF